MPIDRLGPFFLSVLPLLLVLPSTSFLLAGPPPCQTNADCNDGNGCTADVCLIDTGVCHHALNFAPYQCCDAFSGIIVGPCEEDHNACTLQQCLRALPQGQCTPIDITQISCSTDAQCQAYTNGVSPTCGHNNPGFCDCVCGNGVIDGSEECDDVGETAMCDIDCTFAECGDEYVNTAAGEECDDGDPCPCDGCVSCTINFECPGCLCFTVADCRNFSCLDDNACNHVVCGPCGFCVFSCAAYGDVTFSGGQANLDDILSVLVVFTNSGTPDADLAPCGGNGIVNLDDILAVLSAFSGHNPCGCTENTAPGTGISPLCGSSNP